MDSKKDTLDDMAKFNYTADKHDKLKLATFAAGVLGGLAFLPKLKMLPKQTVGVASILLGGIAYSTTYWAIHFKLI